MLHTAVTAIWNASSEAWSGAFGFVLLIGVVLFCVVGFSHRRRD